MHVPPVFQFPTSFLSLDHHSHSLPRVFPVFGHTIPACFLIGISIFFSFSVSSRSFSVSYSDPERILSQKDSGKKEYGHAMDLLRKEHQRSFLQFQLPTAFRNRNHVDGKISQRKILYP